MSLGRLSLVAAGAAVVGFGAAWLLTADRSTASGHGPAEREVLYWVAPMDPNFRSDRPGKSPMGMDLVPVYADEQPIALADDPALRIEAAVVNNIGVKTAPVKRSTLFRTIDTIGYVVPDADRVVHIHVRAEGWIQNLEAATEGDSVVRDGLLFDIYSPALVSAQDEFLQAVQSDSGAIIEAAARRLSALGMAPEQIETLTRSRRTIEQFPVRSPQNGFLMELNVREGMFVQPGNTIMSLADLSSIWVDVDVFEQQIDWVEPGQTARMRMPFASERLWQGKVDYVYPTIRPASRTARVRLAFENPDLALKPNMYARVSIEVAPRLDVLHIPREAVIRTGSQERVIVALDRGRFRPAEVVTGIDSDGRVEIVSGLQEDERVVVSSQFLIDSEASLDASLLRMLDQAEPPAGDPERGMKSGTGHDHHSAEAP